jgi:hypothetical protein
MTLAPGVNVLKLFSLSFPKRLNKLECLYLASLSILAYLRVWLDYKRVGYRPYPGIVI